MRRKKPADWPKLMRAKRLKCGETAYFWEVPSIYQKDCPLASEPLGTDYATAIARAAKLNELYDAWRTGDEQPSPSKKIGTFGWMVCAFEAHEKFKEISPKTAKQYLDDLELIGSLDLLDPKTKKPTGRHVRDLMLPQISEAAADRIYGRLKVGPKGPRLTRANAAMRAARRAWNVCRRAHPGVVPDVNPFAKMELKTPKGGGNEAATREHLEAFAAKAIDLGYPSFAVAAYLGFDLLQRETDIVQRIAWTLYRPADRPNDMKVRHNKTREWFWTPLDAWDDETGEWIQLYPELEDLLASLPRHGPLMVMKDTPDRRSGEYLPWREDYFRHKAREIMDAAGLPKALTFTSFRHGGITELGDGELTDSQIMNLSGHRTPATMHGYNKRSRVKKERGALNRLKFRQARTRRAQVSE